jgi:hypothetical protein
MRASLIILFMTASLCAGCALPLPGISPSGAGGQQQEIKSITAVNLSRDNFKIVKTNIHGTDWGINFLGILPIVSPDYTKAISELYRAGAVTEGKPQAIVNILQQHTAPFFILFSIPRITFRADVVEFVNAQERSIQP